MSVRKPFSERLFKDNDEQARDKAKQLWGKMGYDCQDNPDIYGHDLIVSKNGKTFYSEVEVKRCWMGTFPYDSLQIPSRKKKFTKDNCVFCVFDGSLSQAALVTSKVVGKSPLSTISNKFVGSGERFFQVPVDNVQFVIL